MQNQWDIRYSAEEYVYGTAPNDFLAAQVSHIPAGGNVLCLAEGEGRNAVFLAKAGFQVTGVDNSSVGLEKAQRLAKTNGVAIKTICSDLGEFEILPQSWDAVVSIFCHLPDPLRTNVYRNAVAGLKPGGVFILEAYTPRQLQFRTGGPPYPELLYEPEELRMLLKPLKLDVFQEIHREVVEGKLHRGMSAVLQVVAKKR